MKYLESRMCPIPSDRLEPKFQYFYRPYSYAINTEKYMTFEDSDDAKQRSVEAAQIKQYVTTLKKANRLRSASETLLSKREPSAERAEERRERMGSGLYS